MKTKISLTLMILTVVFGSTLCLAIVGISDKGTWPKSWPTELEPFRDRAKTIEVAHGIQETVYEIPFDDRDEFEKAWPAILKLKSDGGVLILEKDVSTYLFGAPPIKSGVRILWPSEGTSIGSDGHSLTAGPPWPKSALLENGRLPEYVANDNGRWIPADPTNRTGFLSRARVDIVLITDGKIVDLNRIPLPPDTTIIDHRFIDKSMP